METQQGEFSQHSRTAGQAEARALSGFRWTSWSLQCHKGKAGLLLVSLSSVWPAEAVPVTLLARSLCKQLHTPLSCPETQNVGPDTAVQRDRSS